MKPSNSAKRFWTTMTLLLSIVIGLVTNIASSSIPNWLKPYLSYAWPLLLILSVLYLWTQIRSEAGSHSPSNDKDKITFAKTLEILPSQSGAIYFLRTHNFGSAFDPMGDLKELRDFRIYCSRPEFFYLDKELERLKMELLQSFDEFDDRISAETSSWGLNPPLIAIRKPEDYEDVTPEKFYAVKNELNNRAKLICEKYDQLIKTAHRKL